MENVKRIVRVCYQKINSENVGYQNTYKTSMNKESIFETLYNGILDDDDIIASETTIEIIDIDQLDELP